MENSADSTLRSYVDGFAARSGIKVVLTLDQDSQRLEHDAELAIFRIVQESLTNIHRHSHSPTSKLWNRFREERPH